MCRTQAIPLLIDSTHFPLTSKLHNNGFEWKSDHLLLVGSDIGPLQLPPLRQLFFLGTFYTFHKVAKYASRHVCWFRSSHKIGLFGIKPVGSSPVFRLGDNRQMPKVIGKGVLFISTFLSNKNPFICCFCRPESKPLSCATHWAFNNSFYSP